MIFQSPWILVLLVLIPLVFFFSRKNKTAVRVSSLSVSKKLPVSLRQRLLFIPVVLQVAVIILVIIATARPQFVYGKTRRVTEGVAIEFVLDRSGSMAAEMIYKGKYTNRLDIVKDIIEDFIFGDGKELSGRENDLIGLISFAKYADTNFPLSLSHDPLNGFIDGISLVSEESEDGTSIGDALALAAARLENIETKVSDNDVYNIKSKVIIFLTDGENNAGRRTPEEAAALAADWGITVYAVGIGGDESSIIVETFAGERRMPVRSYIDENTLKSITEITGGKYWIASGGESLKEIYAIIDSLEKSEVVSYESIEYKELYIYFAAAALILLVLRILLASTYLRRIP